MRFATISVDGRPTTAVVTDDAVHVLASGRSMRDLIETGLDVALAEGHAALADTSPIDIASVRFLAPLQPTTIRDFVTFSEHVEGVRASIEGEIGVPDAWYAAPHFYFTNPHTVSGPGDSVAAPSNCAALDFELEVAAIVGVEGRDLSVEDAAGAIFGYTILNDWSARDLQRIDMANGLGPAKGKDFANTLGPVIVTADELADRHDADGFLDLMCVATINGVEVGRDVLSNMGWTFPALVAYAARDSMVRPGDVLGSGTVGHGGCLAEWWGRRGTIDPAPLQPGDVVELTVEGIGTLANTVCARTGIAPAIPGPRQRDQAAARAAHITVAR